MERGVKSIRSKGKSKGVAMTNNIINPGLDSFSSLHQATVMGRIGEISIGEVSVAMAIFYYRL